MKEYCKYNYSEEGFPITLKGDFNEIIIFQKKFDDNN